MLGMDLGTAFLVLFFGGFIPVLAFQARHEMRRFRAWRWERKRRLF